MGRLAAVELRKALDTRAGRWFTVSILGLVLVVAVIFAFAAPDGDRDYGDFLGSRRRRRWATSCRSSSSCW